MGFSSDAFSAAFSGAASCSGGAFSGSAFSSAFAAECGVQKRFRLSVPVDVVVSDPMVFESSLGVVSWALSVSVGGEDVSALIAGETVIEAAEDAARLATFSLTPVTSAQLLGFESAAVAIDVVVSGAGLAARSRRFSGFVESFDFLPASRLVTLRCRDGYQERVRACAAAEDVKSLCGDMATVSDVVSAWNDEEPDPESYFREILGTVLGATFIDGAGTWRVFPWAIGAPRVAYDESGVFDAGLILEMPSKADTPAAIVATLSHSFFRLHAAAVPVQWNGLGGLDYTEIGINPPRQEMIVSALEGLGDWRVAGRPVFENFDLVSWPVGLSMTAVLFRRWYQEVTRRFVVTIEMGGASERDTSVSRAISADFDAGEWESGKQQETMLDVYSANPPGPPPPPVETLLGPFPPQNGALDHFAVADDVIVQAVRQVIAEALRIAVQGKRRQRIKLERPVDLRVDIGAVAAVSAYGVTAEGQVQSFVETFNHDSGACVGEYVLACPDGNSQQTGFTAHVEIPLPEVSHSLAAPALTNWVGSDKGVYTYPVDTDAVSGHLTNVLFGAAAYDETQPAFVEQFRVVMPEIEAVQRDPLSEEVAVNVSFEIAGGGVSIQF